MKQLGEGEAVFKAASQHPSTGSASLISRESLRGRAVRGNRKLILLEL